jgi:hypothetical protein
LEQDLRLERANVMQKDKKIAELEAKLAASQARSEDSGNNEEPGNDDYSDNEDSDGEDDDTSGNSGAATNETGEAYTPPDNRNEPSPHQDGEAQGNGSESEDVSQLRTQVESLVA